MSIINNTTNTTVSSATTIAPNANPATMPDMFIDDSSELFFKEGQFTKLADFCQWDASKTEWLEEAGYLM